MKAVVASTTGARHSVTGRASLEVFQADGARLLWQTPCRCCGRECRRRHWFRGRLLVFHDRRPLLRSALCTRRDDWLRHSGAISNAVLSVLFNLWLCAAMSFPTLPAGLHRWTLGHASTQGA